MIPLTAFSNRGTLAPMKTILLTLLLLPTVAFAQQAMTEEDAVKAERHADAMIKIFDDCQAETAVTLEAFNDPVRQYSFEPHVVNPGPACLRAIKLHKYLKPLSGQQRREVLGFLSDYDYARYLQVRDFDYVNGYAARTNLVIYGKQMQFGIVMQTYGWDTK